MNAPQAKQIPHVHRLHGDERPDPYYWLRERENAAVIEHLQAENAWYDEVMKPLQPLCTQLHEEMVARIPTAEASVPVQDGRYWYYQRLERDLQYPVYARKQAADRAALADAPEQVLLDLNQMVEDGGYLSVTLQRVSPNHTLLAYLENRTGTDRYTLFVRDIASGQQQTDRIDDVFISQSVEWDATGRYLFYLTVDESQRPFRLWRHRLGSTEPDDLIYEETDVAFTVDLGKTADGRFLLLNSSTKTCSEVRFLPADDALGAWSVFARRQPNIEYSIEAWRDEWIILTNDGAQNFRLLHAPMTNREDTSPLVPYDPECYLQGVRPFAAALLVQGRRDGLTQIWRVVDNRLELLRWDEPIYTVSLGGNRAYDTSEALIAYESFLTPRTTIALDLATGTRTVLQVAPISGRFEPSDYRQERLLARAEDGTAVPYLIVYRAVAHQEGSPSPTILSGYGSYGATTDPRFNPYSLPLLDRGVILASAQIRGGSELGRAWYEDGKLMNKRNTFTDFIAVADDLIERGYASPRTLAAWGGSAGGLLMGAVANMAGDRFALIAAHVPFVDVVTTMLDVTIPLTSLEWDEWGNPAEPDAYFYMKSYSPYDNVEAKAYPHILVTTGINDPRVGYFEPAKWVARLRERKTDDHTLIMKVNMGAGHFGSSGRISRLAESAAHYAFTLSKLGVIE